jgi:HSP20 family protein
MANVTRYDPFGELATLNRPFRDLFEELSKGFFSPARFLERESQAGIKLDVTENDKEYTVRAEIPGAKKDDVKVTVDGNHVSISAEIKKEKEAKEGEKVLHRESYYGSAYRSFMLDQEVNEAEVKAKYSDGVLTLTLPKKPGTRAKQVSID